MMLKKEVKILVRLGFPEEANNSEWGTFYFPQRKAKTNRVRFLSDFRNLNRQLKRKPYAMAKIREMLLHLEGFQYATPLELNLGYYHIRFRKQDSNLCTIILPWVKYQYKCLPMGVSNSPDIYQEKMDQMFHGFEFIRAYIDELLIIKKGDWSNHLEKSELNIQKFKYNELKCNIEKSFFGQTEMEYLGFWVTWTGIRPINKKV